MHIKIVRSTNYYNWNFKHQRNWLKRVTKCRVFSPFDISNPLSLLLTNYQNFGVVLWGDNQTNTLTSSLRNKPNV